MTCSHFCTTQLSQLKHLFPFPAVVRASFRQEIKCCPVQVNNRRRQKLCWNTFQMDLSPLPAGVLPSWIPLQFRHESSRSLCRWWPLSRVVKSFVSSRDTTIFTGSKFWNMISNSAGHFSSPEVSFPHLHAEIITAQVTEHQNPSSKDSFVILFR